MSNHFFLIVLSLIFSFSLKGQSIGAVIYTAADGLAARNFQTFFQDSRGRLWVGSYGDGVSCFDGETWKKWGTNNGLPNGKIISIYEDHAGNIWLDHNEWGASRLRQGRFEHLMRNAGDETNRRFFFNYCSGEPITWDTKSGNLYRFDDSVQTFLSQGKQLIPANWPQRYQTIGIYQAVTSNSYLVWALHAGARHSDILLCSPGHLPTLLNTMTGPAIRLEPCGASDDGSTVLFNREKKEFQVLTSGRIHPWPVPPLPDVKRPLESKISLEAVGATLISAAPRTLLLMWRLKEKTTGRSRYLLAEYDLQDLHLRKTLIFTTSQLISRCFKDRAGTYWISTDANVIRLFPEYLFIPTDAPGMFPAAWASAEDSYGKVWFSTYGSGLTTFDGLHMQPHGAWPGSTANFDNGSLVDAQGNMYFNLEYAQQSKQVIRGIVKMDGHLPPKLLATGSIGFFLAHDRQGNLLRGMSDRGLWLLPKNVLGSDTSEWVKIDASKGLMMKSVGVALEDKQGRYWMGRLGEGLACYDPRRQKTWNWLKAQNPAHLGIMSMDMDTRGNLWLGTDRGLFFLKTPATIDSSFNLLSVLQSIGTDLVDNSLISALKVYNEHTLLFANTDGIHVLDLDAFYRAPSSTYIDTYNAHNGNELGTVEQNALYVTRDSQVWLTGANGALRFDPQLVVQDTFMQTITIDSVTTDNVTFTDFTHRLVLGRGAQRVRFYFHHDVNSLLLDNIRYRYRLDSTTTWSEPITQPFIDLARLAPGQYFFMIVMEKGGRRSQAKTIHFNIEPLLWQNPLFWSAALIAVLVAGIFFWNRERKIARQKIELEKSKTSVALLSREKDRFQVQAIISQLAPHFINNTLHWLQLRLESDQEAVSVITRFSENIGVVFSNSREKKSHHSLLEEMKVVSNYLFIQKRRFRDALDYNLVETGSLADIQVPLMILQIHVENAIDHGIRRKINGNGSVSVTIADIGDYVLLNVIDDGIGRPSAAKYRSHGFRQGVRMLQELITIYNRQNQLPMSQEYEDEIFTDTDGVRYGTRVIIRIPKIYRYDL